MPTDFEPVNIKGSKLATPFRLSRLNGFPEYWRVLIFFHFQQQYIINKDLIIEEKNQVKRPRMENIL